MTKVRWTPKDIKARKAKLEIRDLRDQLDTEEEEVPKSMKEKLVRRSYRVIRDRKI